MSPAKPTRHDAADSRRMEELEVGAERASGPAVAGEGRQERGSAAENAKHPPHVTPNAEGARVKGDGAQGGDAPVRPANAQGTDQLTTAEQQPKIDDESMYDARPEEDKNRPPSSPTSP